jgi:trigger factor
LEVTVKILEDSKVEMTVVIPAATVEERISKIIAKHGKKAQFKGFRKGKVPASMLQQSFGEQARSEALNELLNETYPEALTAKDLRPIDQGNIEKLDNEPGGEMIYVANIEVEPKVELKQYADVEVDREQRDLQDEDVDKAMENLRLQYANWIPVDAAAQKGDQLVCDLQELNEDGSEIKDRMYRNIQVELGKAQYGEVFDQKMEGIKSGEKRKFDVTNDENDPDPNIAGKTEYYEVDIHEVKHPEMAELDDEFAKEVPPGFDTLEELRARVTQDLELQLIRSKDQVVNNSIIEKLIEINPISIPEKMINARLDQIIERAKSETDNPIDDDIVRSSYNEQVTSQIHWSLIAREIIAQENLALTDEDISNEIKKYAESAGQDPTATRLQLKKGGMMDRFNDELLDRKLMDFLRNAAKITDVQAKESTETAAE